MQSATARPELVANLSLADLDRVRKALALLSDEPAGASGQATARDDGHVPSSVAVSPPEAPTADGDDADTTPLPVILPGAAPVPRPDQLEAPRGPFEPARAAPEASAASAATPVPAEAGSAEALPRAAAEKLDQIKDLLITAEAIGEANLDRHFARVSQRQRELIREFFERARPGQEHEG